MSSVIGKSGGSACSRRKLSIAPPLIAAISRSPISPT
jgi:hypothetical protein